MKENTKKLRRRANNSSKDRFFNSLSVLESDEILEDIILTLKPGHYNVTGDYENTIDHFIIDKFGVYAWAWCSEKIIRGLAIRYPDKIQICFTHGLQQFTVTKVRKY